MADDWDDEDVSVLTKLRKKTPNFMIIFIFRLDTLKCPNLTTTKRAVSYFFRFVFQVKISAKLFLL